MQAWVERDSQGREYLVRTGTGVVTAVAAVGIVDDVPRWSSLVDLRFDDTEEGCRVTWSEAFMFSALSADVHDDVAHLVGGTRLRLNGLRALLDEGA